MARTKNPNTPENGVALATSVEPDTAASARVLALVNGQPLSDWLRDLIVREVQSSDVQITVNGKSLTAAGVAKSSK